MKIDEGVEFTVRARFPQLDGSPDQWQYLNAPGGTLTGGWFQWEREAAAATRFPSFALALGWLSFVGAVTECTAIELSRPPVREELQTSASGGLA
ncbi:MAG TPA: hypothetical protein VN579_07290 [Bryobacteraceae bacterium]|nr:hypothetical protein [Bryobacteraceae bacterium]